MNLLCNESAKNVQRENYGYKSRNSFFIYINLELRGWIEKNVTRTIKNGCFRL